MSAITQINRLLQIDTPLGENEVILTNLIGEESLSNLFHFQLEIFSTNTSITAQQLVGQSITFWIQSAPGQTPRYFNGYISQLSLGGLQLRGERRYQVEVVPWLWFLTRATDCKVFQNLTAVEIIENIFQAYGFSNYDTSGLSASYATREYCVQYRETAFNFVSRLMEEEGIFYYFTHEMGKHTLVLGDQGSAYTACVDSPVTYAVGSPAADILVGWEHCYAFFTGQWTQTDYNFQTPSTSLLNTVQTSVSLPNTTSYEFFDYPGGFDTQSLGETNTEVRIEAEEANYEMITGVGYYPNFGAGTKFELQTHTVSAEEGSYILTKVRHEASDASQTVGEGESQGYQNSFVCIPETVSFRPPRQTPKPTIQGLQTAMVVGPSGNEIYTDEYGRIIVQFYWDRVGQQNENSSCWIRVAQQWAGANWGALFIPRIGQEVVVAFLEGDPDRPLVIGSVYNALQMPPFDLPSQQTQSGIRGHSTTEGGSTANEWHFEDSKGNEQFYMFAQKDFNRVVTNDDTLQVGQNQTITVTNDRTETVQQGNESVTIEQGNRTVVVSTGNDIHQIKQGNREVDVSAGNDSLTVSQGNRTVEISMGNHSLEISQGNQTTSVKLGSSSLEAMQSIELKVGENSISISQTGITIQGCMVTINGQTMVQIEADAMLEMTGGIVSIN